MVLWYEPKGEWAPEFEGHEFSLKVAISHAPARQDDGAEAAKPFGSDVDDF